ncbi:nucleotidyltransferase family protein [Chitinibacter sp. SCUT-21]|uniref:nucleotidyltransferase family protein n=1 Tax=Chitinibacter sp. SCUT-21 TaxID=2970891 RepID=UPI0035A6CCF7
MCAEIRLGTIDLLPQNMQQLIQWIRAEESLMAALRLARSLELPQWCIAAGSIRNLVWDRIHGFDFQLAEIDLIYWDDRDISSERDQAAQQQLSQLAPHWQWDVCNQAGVHRWYRNQNGQAIVPFSSTLAAMASWPETATAIGASLDQHDALHIWAPPLYGGESALLDLFALRLRHNPTQVSRAVFEQRVQDKQFLQRWPKLHLMKAYNQADC